MQEYAYDYFHNRLPSDEVTDRLNTRWTDWLTEWLTGDWATGEQTDSEWEYDSPTNWLTYGETVDWLTYCVTE